MILRSYSCLFDKYFRTLTFIILFAMKKIWKEIFINGQPCQPRREISNYGEIRRIICDSNTESYIYKNLRCHSGHPVYRVGHKDNGKMIYKGGTLAKLVATYFIENPNNFKYVKHIDGNVLNCRADNLEWVEYQTSILRRVNRSTFGQIEINGIIYDNINHAIRELNNVQHVKGAHLTTPEIEVLCAEVTETHMRNMVKFGNPTITIGGKPAGYKMLYTPQVRQSIPDDTLAWKEILIDGRQCQPRREISTKGDIRRIKEHECDEEFYYKPSWSDGHPCYYVSYIRNGIRIEKKGLLSILVAMHFIDNPHQYKHVRHIDGDIKNCAASNLEWVKFKVSSSPRIAVSAYGRIVIEGFDVVYGNLNEAVRKLTKSGVHVTVPHIKTRIKRGKDTIKINGIETRYKMLDVPDHPANNW